MWGSRGRVTMWLSDRAGEHIWFGNRFSQQLHHRFWLGNKDWYPQSPQQESDPLKVEIAAWPTGKIIKDPQKAVSPESMTQATTFSSTSGKQSYDLLDTISVGPSLGKNAKLVQPKTLWKYFHNTCIGIPKLWYMCHQLHASHLEGILYCAVLGIKPPQKSCNFLLALLDLHKGYRPACLWQHRWFLNEEHLQMLCTWRDFK